MTLAVLPEIRGEKLYPRCWRRRIVGALQGLAERVGWPEKPSTVDDLGSGAVKFLGPDGLAASIAWMAIRLGA